MLVNIHKIDREVILGLRLNKQHSLATKLLKIFHKEKRQTQINLKNGFKSEDNKNYYHENKIV